MDSYSKIANALIDLDESKVVRLLQETLIQKADPTELLNKGLIAAMDVIGDKMENEEIFIPEVLKAAKAMHECLEILRPHLGKIDNIEKGKVVIGTVKGDLHDIGKNLVAMMLECGGFKVFDLGVDISADQFLTALKENNAEILCLSALLTTTMPMMQDIINKLREAGFRDQVKILVGGAPINQDFADQIGADGYAPDAASAAKLVKSFI